MLLFGSRFWVFPRQHVVFSVVFVSKMLRPTIVAQTCNCHGNLWRRSGIWNCGDLRLKLVIKERVFLFFVISCSMFLPAQWFRYVAGHVGDRSSIAIFFNRLRYALMEIWEFLIKDKWRESVCLKWLLIHLVASYYAPEFMGLTGWWCALRNMR